jgi:hypothetical protein
MELVAMELEKEVNYALHENWNHPPYFVYPAATGPLFDLSFITVGGDASAYGSW